MKRDIPRNNQRNNNSTGRFISFIADEYKDPQTSPMEALNDYFPTQKAIFSRTLWTTKRSALRIVPGNYKGELFPQVINANVGWSEDADYFEYLPDTFYMTSTVSKFGDSGLEFITNLKPGSPEAEVYAESPVNFFCNTIHRTVKRIADGKKTSVKMQPEWKNWVNLGGILPFPKDTLLFQAVCLELNGRQFGEEGADPIPVYAVIGINNKLSVQALVKALVEPMNPSRPIGADNNKYGSIAEANGNILYFNPGEDTAEKKVRKLLRPCLGEDPKNWTPIEYNLPENFCTELWQPWDRVLKYMTCEEQINLLAQEFGYDTVNYIFSLDHMWDTLEIPENIKSAGLGRFASRNTVQVEKPAQSYKPMNAMPAMNTPKPSVPKPAQMPDIQARINAIKAAAKPKAEPEDDIVEDIDPKDIANMLLDEEE